MNYFSYDRPHKKGTDLSPAAQKQVLACYVHRFTLEHVPQWSRQPMANGQAYQPQFASDVDWLENTLFNVNRDGTLADASCYSTPTWPRGNSLQTAVAVTVRELRAEDREG